MEVPVLSQSQKSKALSGNKSKQKKKTSKIRNVLANFSTRCFSINLSEQDSITFEERLSEIFLHRTSKKPKWEELVKIPKEKRSEFRKSLQKPKNPLMRNLLFGINEVTRSIENQSSKFVLLTNDINPPILARHIYEGCKTHEIPLFEVVDLRSISQKCFGFPTIAMAFKNLSDDLIIIKEFFTMFVTERKQITNKKPPKSKTNINRNPNSNNSSKTSETPKTQSETYLMRNNNKSRCFVPPITSNIIKSNTNKPDISMDYIALPSDDNDDANESDDGGETNELVYQNLKVKRIKPNSNRRKGKKKFKKM